MRPPHCRAHAYRLCRLYFRHARKFCVLTLQRILTRIHPTAGRMGAAAAAAKRELTWIHVFLAFTGGLLFAVPLAHSISSRTRVALIGSGPGPPAAPGTSGSGGASAAPQHFCPWDTRHSVFQKAGKVINFRHNQTACLDAILYGMDMVWGERAGQRGWWCLGWPAVCRGM